MRKNAIILLFGTAILLGISGIVFLNGAVAASSGLSDARADRYLAAGITCLATGSVLLLTGSILAFLAGKERE